MIAIGDKTTVQNKENQMCKECGMAYSFVFGIQFHKTGCAVSLVEAKLERAATILDETGAHEAAKQVRALNA